jgi:hypothetical protein
MNFHALASTTPQEALYMLIYKQIITYRASAGPKPLTLSKQF